MAVAAAASWGIFSALGRRRPYEPLTSLFVFILTGLVIAGCILPFTGGRHVPVGWEFYGAFHIGFLSNTLGVMLWLLALKEGGASVVGNLALLAAFVNLVLIRLLLPDQTISPWASRLKLMMLPWHCQQPLTASAMFPGRPATFSARTLSRLARISPALA